MKKQNVLFPLVIILAMLSCKKDPDVYTTNENTTNNYIVTDDFDLKANKMLQASSAFPAIARQPEMSSIIIQSTEMIYSNYTVLLPLSDKAVTQRGKARGAAFGSLFAAIARQPEAYPTLDSVAAKFLGIYDQTYISADLEDITKTFAMDSLNMSLARQPECDSVFNLVSIKYLNFDINNHKKVKARR
jgi:F0F1-type ATP synthase membrane subunit c/vacuolar-type H+-ATPase subunit K